MYPLYRHLDLRGPNTGIKLDPRILRWKYRNILTSADAARAYFRVNLNAAWICPERRRSRWGKPIANRTGPSFPVVWLQAFGPLVASTTCVVIKWFLSVFLTSSSACYIQRGEGREAFFKLPLSESESCQRVGSTRRRQSCVPSDQKFLELIFQAQN